MIKTNAMRQLDKKKIPYEVLSYEYDESDLSGVHAANFLGLDMDKVYKTLVCRGEKKGYVVFCIPVDKELDLKKCAVAVSDKKVEMIAVKELLPLTGYVRGGCSPIGMKKSFPCFIQKDCADVEKISISAGVRGEQIYIETRVLVDFLRATPVDVVKI